MNQLGVCQSCRAQSGAAARQPPGRPLSPVVVPPPPPRAPLHPHILPSQAPVWRRRASRLLRPALQLRGAPRSPLDAGQPGRGRRLGGGAAGETAWGNCGGGGLRGGDGGDARLRQARGEGRGSLGGAGSWRWMSWPVTCRDAHRLLPLLLTLPICLPLSFSSQVGHNLAFDLAYSLHSFAQVCGPFVVPRLFQLPRRRAVLCRAAPAAGRGAPPTALAASVLLRRCPTAGAAAHVASVQGSGLSVVPWRRV